MKGNVVETSLNIATKTETWRGEAYQRSIHGYKKNVYTCVHTSVYIYICMNILLPVCTYVYVCT